MSNLLSGLEDLGLSGLDDMEVYGDVEHKEKTSVKAEAEKQEKTEDEYLFDKTYTCPVCNDSFKTSTVRTGKAKLIGTDSDLRPRYQGLDPLKYDAVVCSRCGYAALSRFFPSVTGAQSRLIMEQISQKFHATIKSDGVFTYDDAILRHRLALASAVVKHSRVSERAYICLKSAWLLRGKQEECEVEEEKKELHAQEQEFLQAAYEGFNEATSKEDYPICGMDEMTMLCLLADIARRIGKYDEAGRLISRILVARNASERIKNKAREIKDLMLAAAPETK